MALCAGELAVELLFTLAAYGAASQLAAATTGEETPGAESLQDDRDRHRFVTAQRPVCRVQRLARKCPVTRVALAPVDHHHARPTPYEIAALAVRATIQQRR